MGLDPGRPGLRLSATAPRWAPRGGAVRDHPTTDWRWLLISSPHSSTTFDLVHTSATAAGLLGLCLLLTRHAPSFLYLPLVATGSMTLTLYTAHVLALASGSPLLLTDNRLLLWLAHVVTVLVVGTLWRARLGRGPLEGLAAQIDRAARRQVGGRRRRGASAPWWQQRAIGCSPCCA